MKLPAIKMITSTEGWSLYEWIWLVIWGRPALVILLQQDLYMSHVNQWNDIAGNGRWEVALWSNWSWIQSRHFFAQAFLCRSLICVFVYSLGVPASVILFGPRGSSQTDQPPSQVHFSPGFRPDCFKRKIFNLVRIRNSGTKLWSLQGSKWWGSRLV